MKNTALFVALLTVPAMSYASQVSQVPDPIANPDMVAFSVAEEDGFVTFGRDGGRGDVIVWNSDLELEDGTRIGSNAGSCTRLDAAGSFICNMQLSVDGEGQLTFTGIQRTEPQVSEMVINGGTGSFLGARGRVLSVPVEDRARFRYEIEFLP